MLPFDAATVLVLGNVVAESRRSGRPMGFANAQIAATARIHGLNLVTRKVKDLEQFKVQLINPWLR